MHQKLVHRRPRPLKTKSVRPRLAIIHPFRNHYFFAALIFAEPGLAAAEIPALVAVLSFVHFLSGLTAALIIQTDQYQQRLRFAVTFILTEFPHQMFAKGHALIFRSVVVPFIENNWMPRLVGFGNMSEVRTACPSLTKTSIED